MSYIDHFSGHADRYETYRPTYPKVLHAYLASLVSTHDLAWDCATGNGQTALGLVLHFLSVVANDASPQQLALARPHDRIAYIVAPAERVPLTGASIDLMRMPGAQASWLFPHGRGDRLA